MSDIENKIVDEAVVAGGADVGTAADVDTKKKKYRQKRKEKDGIKSKRSGSKKNVWLQLCAGCGSCFCR